MRDDRDKPVVLADARPKLRHRSFHRTWRHTPPTERRLLWLAIVALIVGALGFATMGERLAVLAVGLGVIVAAYQQYRAHPHVRRAALIEERTCPACLYDLHGIPQAEDGCTVCPECSGAWRLRDTA